MTGTPSMTTHSVQTPRRSWPHLLVILVVGLAVAVPVAMWGFCAGEPIHLVWSRYFSNQLWSGELYPRWLMDMNSGLGSPTFFFYGAVPYYVTSLLQAVLPYRDFGWPALGVSASLALVGSAFAAFFWLRDAVGRAGALAGALAYMLLPYHLEMDHLVRFAFTELWALVWLPLVLACAHRCIHGDSRALVPLALSYALLVMTHAPATLVCSAVPVAYALSMAPRGHVRLAALRVVGGMFLGGMLGAIFLVPALTTQQSVSIQDITEGYFSYAQHFLFTTAPFDLPGKSQGFIDYALTFRSAMNRATRSTALCLFGGYLVTFLLVRAERHGTLKHAGQLNGDEQLRFACFWAVIGVVSLFMMSTWSAGIWRALPVLQKVQFPWRFNILLLCATAAVLATACALLIDYASQLRKSKMKRRSPAFSLALVVAAGIVALFGVQLLSATKALNEDRLVERTVPARVLIADYAGFRPSTLRKELFEQEVIRSLGESLPLVGIAQGTGSLAVLSWRPRRIVLAVDAKTELQLVVKQLYYPGWSARAPAESAVYPVTPAEPVALVSVQVPQGRHEVVVTLDATSPERLGQIISGVALAVILLIAWRSRRNPPSA
jgi:uncharacterized membrane protein